MKKRLIIPILVLLVSLACVVAGTAFSWIQYSKEIAGQGDVVYVGHVTVDDIKVHVKKGEITVTLISTDSTIADYEYTVYLELDDVLESIDTVSWAVGEIPGTKKYIIFTGLVITTETEVFVEVVK